MKTIAIVSQKGGTGKTTLALNLAAAAERLKFQTVVVDLDPQASAKLWYDLRVHKAENNSPVVISAQAAVLPDVLNKAKTHGADLIIIDTAPHSETAALAAARAADLILIPCRPSYFDLGSIKTTIDLAALAKAKTIAFLNAVPARGTLADEAQQVINNNGLNVSPVRLGQRAAFVHSLTIGKSVLEYEPHGKAAQEIKSAYKWTCKLVGMSTCKPKNRRKIA